MKALYEELQKYSESDYYGFHMPGHKRNPFVTGAHLPYSMDITEIEGFDDLHHARGILKDLQERASKVYGAQETKLLINGSTVGILSAILGCTREGDRILVARNCHKSVYHALFLNKLSPIYIYPRFDSGSDLNGEISPSEVERILERYPDITAVVVTSPTYDGVLSDIRKIAEKVHEKRIPLIVDEAHGAHLGFHPYFLDSAVQNGADLVVHSLHKTMPALTQTALLHKSGPFADWDRVCYYLDILQTSSPSYILMGSIDVCISWIEKQGAGCFSEYAKLLDETRKRLGELENLRLLETSYFDPSKLVISVGHTRYTGREVYKMLLEDYHLQMEMAAETYVLAMTSVGDTREGMERLVEALFQIDTKAVGGENICGETQKTGLPQLSMVYTPAQIREITDRARQGRTGKSAVKRKSWESGIGHISMEYAYVYPPGIPLIVPGERISQEAVLCLQRYREAGFQIEGLKEENEIEVWHSE